MYAFDDGHVSSYTELCDACARRRGEHNRRFSGLIDGRFPALSSRTRNTLHRRWGWEDGGFERLLAATDDEILAARNMGPAGLREWRSFWPRPVDALDMGPWEEHAGMVALAEARHDRDGS